MKISPGREGGVTLEKERNKAVHKHVEEIDDTIMGGLGKNGASTVERGGGGQKREHHQQQISSKDSSRELEGRREKDRKKKTQTSYTTGEVPKEGPRTTRIIGRGK